jgi:hypothetical protein
VAVFCLWFPPKVHIVAGLLSFNFHNLVSFVFVSLFVGSMLLVSSLDIQGGALGAGAGG